MCGSKALYQFGTWGCRGRGRGGGGGGCDGVGGGGGGGVEVWTALLCSGPLALSHPPVCQRSAIY